MTINPMTCDHAKIEIQRSLDGLLPPEERSALQAHLELCAVCRREQGAQRRLTRLADQWASRAVEVSDPGEEWTARLLARLETRQAPASRPLWLPLAAALLLLGALLLVPGTKALSLGMTAQNLMGLPVWLRLNVTALPVDLHTAFQVPQAVWLPAWTTALLFGAFLLNAGFCVRARQRSLS